MKILFITFSNTGNTQYVATTLGAIIQTRNGDSVEYIDAIPVIQQLDLGNTQVLSEFLGKEFPLLNSLINCI
jgi:flavodoxin